MMAGMLLGVVKPLVAISSLVAVAFSTDLLAAVFRSGMALRIAWS
jgi:hypothetical protein